MIDKAKMIIHTIEPSLKKYQAIMERFSVVDVSIDTDFQRKFNGFYKVRQRNASFYRSYYSLMERSKIQPIDFRGILEQLYNELGRLEPSFSSKLLATINPDMPIWDVFVLENLNLKKPTQYSKTRLDDTVRLYERIIEWYQGTVNSSEGIELMKLFDSKYPDADISDVKKIDFILWQIRE